MQARLQTAIQMIYPPRCLSCGGLVASDFGLCGVCWGDTPFIHGLACDGCGVPLPGQSDQSELCDDCLTLARPWHHGRSAMLYQGKARRLVMGLKHGDRHDIARPAAAWMAARVRDLVTPETLIVPVPLHRWRLARRRFNQAALLGAALAKELQVKHCPDALVRVRQTRSLDHRSRHARFEELQDAIAPNPRRAAMLEGRKILIVDDVMTSGATLAAATEAALGARAREVSVVVLARAARRP